ncbi:efflux RND transporter permease subunit [Candidatus Fermentibacteria bacterium]|nr:efflux RND transporter permease subunit [Candidatus Fermentibacteria bacterium]
MSIARGPVHRPVLTTVVFIVVITIGVVALSRLSIDLMPEITFPSVSVVTEYGNVGPEEIEESITKPIEEALAAVQGAEEITSTSSEGSSQVQVAFAWGTDLDVATNDIRDRLDRVMDRLPEDASRPMIRKFDLSAFPVMILGAAGNLSLLELRHIVDEQVEYRLERVPGVAAVDIRGGLSREIHVDLHAQKLKALGISPDAVVATLRSENQNLPAGPYREGTLEVLVRTQGEYRSLEEIRQTVIMVRGGTPIRISDVAEVNDSWEEVRQVVRIDGASGIRIAVNKQSGANTVSVAEGIRAEVARINRDIPQIRLTPIIDTSTYIKQSIATLRASTLVGGTLAVIILFTFLRSISSTLIIATAIPISIMAAFGLMYFGGFTLNIITFGGLALGIGMLVDSAIVVLENIYRHRESGLSPVESALTGTGEVAAAITASTLTTLVVFFPVVFVRGMSGILFQQMAYVVSFSLLCSLAVALTLIPMLSSRILAHRGADTGRPGGRLARIYAASENALCWLEERYSSALLWALGHRRRVLLAAAGMLAVSLFLMRFVGVELMPAADEGQVRVTIEMAPGTRVEVVDNVAQAVEEIVRRQVPEATSILARVGNVGFRSSGSHTAEVTVSLVPRAQRRRSSEQVANDLRKPVSGLPGATTRVRAGQGFFVLRMGQSSSNSVTIEIRGYDLETAETLAQRVDAVVKTIPGITDTRLNREEGSPERIVRIDRQRAADLGLGVARIGDALRTAVGGTRASFYREGGTQYPILVRLSEADRQNLGELLDLSVINTRGEAVALRNVVTLVTAEGPLAIARKDQERVISIEANYTGRDMGSVIRDIRAGLQGVPIPRDFAVLFGGDYEEQQEAFRELLLGLILAIFLVYLVMAAQFESFRDPFVVLFAIPMGLVGVVFTMILTGTIFSMQAFIGCIILAGIVVNNAILLVTYTNQLRRAERLPLRDAIMTAGSRRLRPILMTTLTTSLGLLPLSIGLGEGGETQAPLARVVIGGLLGGMLITLIVIPVIYSLVEQRLASARGEARQ